MSQDIINNRFLEESVFAIADGYCVINLSKNIVRGSMYQVVDGKVYNLNEQLGMPENSNLQILVDAWALTIPEEGREDFLKEFNRESLLNRFENGERHISDMYPQYWTPSIGGIFMKYSYEYKKKCVELYRQGKWPETPEGVNEKRFHDTIRIWVRTEDACGPEALRHKNQNKVWATEEKYELIAKILAGASYKEMAISAGISDGLLYQWVRCYKMKGYQGLAAQQKGRPPKEPAMKKKIVPAKLTPSEREEMIRLRAENKRLRAEITVVKKEIALREERCAAQLKAKRLRSSKNSTKKDTD